MARPGVEADSVPETLSETLPQPQLEAHIKPQTESQMEPQIEPLPEHMQAVLCIPALPDKAIEAAAAFYSDWQGRAEALMSGEGQDALAIILPPAAYDHEDWRRAAVRDLARAHAPRRVNMVAGDKTAQIEAIISYLAQAPGVTGQYFVLAATE